MPIKIGEQSFTTRRPKYLDAQLVASTGHNAAEVARLLGENPLPGTIARALMPFLDKNAPAMADLAHVIGQASIIAVLTELRALYANDAPDDGAPEGAE